MKVYGLLLVLEKSWPFYDQISQVVDEKDLEDLPDLKHVDRYIKVTEFQPWASADFFA
jgi:hypothetical protein